MQNLLLRGIIRNDAVAILPDAIGVRDDWIGRTINDSALIALLVIVQQFDTIEIFPEQNSVAEHKSFRTP